MAMNSTPGFLGTLGASGAHATAANTAKDGTGTVYTLVTGATNGTAVFCIDIKSEVTTTAGTYRIFYVSGGVSYLWREGLMAANTSSGSVATFMDQLRSGDGLPLINLKSGDTLKVCINNAEATDFVASVQGDF